MAALAFGTGAKDDGPAAAESGPVTIDAWVYPAVTEAGPPPPDWKVVQVLKERFNIDFKFSMVPSALSDWDVKINAAGAANVLPDIMEVRREPWLKLVSVGLIAPVDDLYAQMTNRSKLMYGPESKSFTTINGKSYGLASPGAIPKKEGMLIRKDWLDKLGLKAPVTIDDFFNVMKAFTFNDPDGNGRADTWGYGAFIEIYPYEEALGRRFDPIFGAFGVAGTWNMTRANAGLNVRKPAYYDALLFVKKMVDEKVIDPNWLSYKKDDFRAAWKQGRFGIMREDAAAFAAENNYAPFDKNFPSGEWIVFDPPKGPKGDMSVGALVNNWYLLAISTNAAKQGKAPVIAKVLEWLSSDEGYYLAGWGEEGVNYVLDVNGLPTDKGLPDPNKFFSKSDIVPITQLRRWVYYQSDFELKARYPTYKAAVSGKTMSALTVIREMQKRPWTDSDGADTMPTPNADVIRFYEQGVIEFLTGQNGRVLNPQNWAAWVAEFDKIGGADWEKSGLAHAQAGGYLK
jgi:putative aldouronate transport system substrate-binding protein